MKCICDLTLEEERIAEEIFSLIEKEKEVPMTLKDIINGLKAFGICFIYDRSLYLMLLVFLMSGILVYGLKAVIR